MELIKINSNNRPYYSDDFINGFECGAKRQFETDKKARPKGKWIEDGSGREFKVMCNHCKCKSWDYITDAQYFDYCPNCGVSMTEREAET